MLKNYLTIALRNLRRHKGYTAINAGGLAVGLATCLLIVLWVQHELSYDRFHAEAERIYRVLYIAEGEDGSEEALAQTPRPLASALDSAFAAVERAVRINRNPGVVRRGAQSFREEITFADDGFFQMFSFPLERGDARTALRAPNTAVLSTPAAQKYFGDENPVGQRLSVRLGGAFYDVTVTGVAAPLPENSSIRFDVLLPLNEQSAYRTAFANDNWGTLSPRLYVQLASPKAAIALSEQIPAFIERSIPEGFHAKQLRLQPLAEVHRTPSVTGGLAPTSDPSYAYILIGIALVVLLMACINFTTLAVGRSAGRVREVGIRKVMGAVRAQLMRQFWGEALLMSALAFLLSVALARLALPFFNALAGTRLHLGAWTDPVMLSVGTGLFLLVGLVAGGYPAVYLSRFEPTEVLTGRFRVGGRSRFTAALLVVQLTVSTALIICTLFMGQQLHLLQTRNLGFEQEQVVRLGVPPQEGVTLWERMQQALADEPRVQSVAASWNQIGGGEGVGFNRLPTTAGAQEIEAASFKVSPGALETLDLALAQGRPLSASKGKGEQAAPQVVVNEAFVKEMGWDDPLGRRVSVLFGVQDAPIVGVVKDFHFESLHEKIRPLVIDMSGPFSTLYVRFAAGDPQTALRTVEVAWNQVAPELPFAFTFLDEAVEQQYRAETRWTRTVTTASVLAIFIACLGLFGLAAFAAERRRKEIGIRKVLGASVASVVGLLSKDFLKLVLIAFVVAAPVAYVAMRRWLEDFAYRVELSPWLFLAAGAAALGIALATVSVQAVRAALADPVEALRSE